MIFHFIIFSGGVGFGFVLLGYCLFLFFFVIRKTPYAVYSCSTTCDTPCTLLALWYIKMDDMTAPPNHLNYPLEAGFSVGHIPCIPYVSEWDTGKKKSTCQFFSQDGVWRVETCQPSLYTFYGQNQQRTNKASVFHRTWKPPSVKLCVILKYPGEVAISRTGFRLEGGT